MINPLARMLGQAEVNFADLSRRAVESVTVPIRLKSQEIVADTVDAASRAVRTIVIKGVLGLVAAAMAIVAVVYFVGALEEALLPALGLVKTRLVMAGVFALIAIVAVIMMLFWPQARPKPTAARAASDARTAMMRSEAALSKAARVAAEHDEASAALREADAVAGTASDNLKVGFETIVSVLGEAGFRREQAGLKAGLALASQLKPMQIVSLALIGGFVAGFRSFPRRR